jgi:hypothetical protein
MAQAGRHYILKHYAKAGPRGAQSKPAAQRPSADDGDSDFRRYQNPKPVSGQFQASLNPEAAEPMAFPGS